MAWRSVFALGTLLIVGAACAPAPPVAHDPEQAPGSRGEMTVSQIETLRAHLAQCYRGSQDMPEPETRWASVRAVLNPDGSFAAPPVVVDHSGGEYGEIVAQRALDAVTECAPYDFLPTERYDGSDGWNTMILNFVGGGLP
ncbi:MAG: hypothetical protein PVI23_13840 [Maricaulaceae bacterium]|jgi:hypothetical protein